MYAVIESGGKQYRVELGNEIEVDRLEVEPGQTIQLDRVLLVADGDAAEIGRPLVDDAIVNADVLRQDRGDKIVVFKYKPKARTRVKKGFRADLTVLRISEIAFGGRSAARDAAAADAEAKAAREAVEADRLQEGDCRPGARRQARVRDAKRRGREDDQGAHLDGEGRRHEDQPPRARPSPRPPRLARQAGEDKTAPTKSAAAKTKSSTAKADTTAAKPTKAQKPAADADETPATEETKDE